MNAVHVQNNGAATTQEARQILAAQTTWRIDPAASRVEFTIGKRLMFVKRLTVTGRFADVKGTIMLDE